MAPTDDTRYSRGEDDRSWSRSGDDLGEGAGDFPWRDEPPSAPSYYPPAGGAGAPPPGGAQATWDPPPSAGGMQAAQPTGSTVWAALGTGYQVELAGAGTRLAARILDWIFIWVIALVIVLPPALATEGTATWVYWLLLITVAGLGILYEPVMVKMRGQTVGKMMMKIKVVLADNGQLPGWGRSIGRWALPGLLGIIPIVGPILTLLCYASLVWHKARQGFHDRAAGTVVIRV